MEVRARCRRGAPGVDNPLGSELIDQLPDVFERLSEVTEPRVFVTRLAKDGCAIEPGARSHLSVCDLDDAVRPYPYPRVHVWLEACELITIANWFARPVVHADDGRGDRPLNR